MNQLSSLEREVEDLLRRECFSQAFTVLVPVVATTSPPKLRWLWGCVLLGVGRHAEAIVELEQTQQQLQVEVDVARCRLDLASAYNRHGEPVIAQNLLDRAKETFVGYDSCEELFRCEQLQSAIYSRQGRWAQAADMARQIFDDPCARNFPSVVVSAGRVMISALRFKGDYSMALNYIHKALLLAESNDLAFQAGSLIYNWAAIAQETGDDATALHQLALARQYAQMCGSHLLLGDIATLHANLTSQQGDWQTGLDLHEQARLAYEQCGYVEGEALCHFNVGGLLVLMGQHFKALPAFDRALRLAEACNSQRVLPLASWGVGVAYRRLGNIQKALSFLLQAVTRFETAHNWSLATAAAAEYALIVASADRVMLIKRIQHWISQMESSLHRAFAAKLTAALLAQDKRHDEAAELLSEAKAFFNTSGSVFQIIDCDLLDIHIAMESQSSIALDLSETERKLQSIRTGTLGLPEFQARAYQLSATVALQAKQYSLALQHLIDAIAQVQLLHAPMGDPLLSGYHAHQLEMIYCNATQLANQLGNLDMLIWIATQRRRNWRQRRQGEPLGLGNTATSIVNEQLSTIALDIRSLRAHISNKSQTLTNEEISTDINRLHTAYERLDHQLLMQTGPMLLPAVPYQGLLENIRDSLCARFGHKWTAIQIEPLDQSNSSWVLTLLSPAQAKSKILRSTHASHMWLRMLTNTSASYVRGLYQDPMTSPILRKLAEWFGVEDWLLDVNDPNHILLICDCELFTHLPFAVLPARNGCLVEQATLAFVTSLYALETATPKPSIQSAMLVAPIHFGKRAPTLPQAIKDVQISAKLWPNHTILEGTLASIERLREENRTGALAQFDLIHLATHATFDMDRPRLSSLSLSDGELTAQEISSWSLSAELVCIAGCHGANTWNAGGEERFGLESAFLAAGAKYVLSNLWPIHDVQSSVFWQEFAQNYARDLSAMDALANTMRSLRNTPAYDWAGWRLHLG